MSAFCNGIVNPSQVSVAMSFATEIPSKVRHFATTIIATEFCYGIPSQKRFATEYWPFATDFYRRNISLFL